MLTDQRFHHIGIATYSIENTSKHYLEASYNMSSVVFDPIQNVNIAFLKRKGNPLIELIEPIDEKSPIYEILKKSGVSPYHICYEVDDIEESIALLKREQFIPLSKPVHAVAIKNQLICFLYHKNVGLIELLEKNSL